MESRKLKNCAFSGEFIFCNKRKGLSPVLAAAVKWKMFQIGCGKWGNDFKWQPIPEKWTSLLMASFLEKVRSSWSVIHFFTPCLSYAECNKQVF